MYHEKDFFRMVWKVAAKIPQGRLTSYGAIAKYLGSARSSRMVGWAMNASHSAPFPIPAHRVLNRNGMLTGKAFFEDPNAMQAMLEAEGHHVKNDQVVGFKSVFWDPEIELKL